MYVYLGDIPAGVTFPFMFPAYDSNGASVTITGLATTDIEIYKGTSVTQRSSDNGFALIDTDGIDIDSTTGIHGFSVDFSDNTDSGFYAAGSFYNLVVNAVTIDSQTVRFIYAFRLCAAENTAGTKAVDTVRLGGTSQTGRDIGASVLLSSGTGTGQLDFTSGVVKANTTLIEGSDATDQLAAAAGGGGKVIRAPHLGDIAEDDTIAFLFNTVGANGAPITLAGTPVISVYKGSNTTERAGAEITLTVNSDSRTGTHSVSIDLSGDAFYATAEDYSVVITTGTVDGTSVVGAVVGSFSIENRFAEVDVTKLGGGAQSATDLKDFADDGYDPSTNKVQGVVLTDTVTTYTGNTPQTGDGYAIVNSGTHGNAALKTLIDTIDTVVDAIKVKTDNLPSDPADASVVAGLIAAVQAVVDAIVVDTNELQTDWTDGGRLDLLLDAIKVVTDATNSAQSEPTGVPAANATPLVKLAWLFMALRNKLEITATDKTFYDDGGAAEWKKGVSDDGTTYAETEATTP
jgi:hypothetical protein